MLYLTTCNIKFYRIFSLFLNFIKLDNFMKILASRILFYVIFWDGYSYLIYYVFQLLHLSQNVLKLSICMLIYIIYVHLHKILP